MNERLRRHVHEVLPMMLIVAVLLAFCLYSALEYGRRADEMPVLPIEWTNAEGIVSGTMIVPEEADGSSICFYSVYSQVRVFLDGNEIYSFLKPAGEKHMQAAPSFWNNVSLPEGSIGAELEIRLDTPYEQYAGIYPEVRCGSAEQARHFVVMKTVPRFVLALAIMFIGLVFCVVAVVMRYYSVGNTGLYSLSLFIVVLALFLAAQQTGILLEINDRVSYILLQNLAFMFCPIMYSRHLMRIHSGRLQKLDVAIHALGILNLAAVVLMHLFTEMDMPQMMVFTRVLCAALIVYEFIQEVRRKHRFLVCTFAVLMLYAVLRYYSTDTVTWLVYVGIFAYIYVLIYRTVTAAVQSQAKQIRLEAALEVSKSEIATIQITSHFFYHTLDSIRALIRLDADKAYKMTGDFAKYVRHRVDGVERMQETVPFSRELRSIRAYTDIKQAQLGERFEMIYDVETEDFDILPLTVQPLVENAVIHAVQRRREGGVVRLLCRETQHGYHIEVIDNGPGPNAGPEAEDRQKQSTAIRNVTTRLEFYGIAPPLLERNELGGITASLDTPKKIIRKGKTE